MNTVYRTFIFCMLSLLLQNCNDDTFEASEETMRQANVTLLVTPNGLGDNGYDDDAAKGIFAFMEESGVPVQLLLPEDMTEAETMYQEWLSQNASRDSSVLVTGSSAYVDMLKRSTPQLSGKGSRVLLFESDETIDGASTLMISHYGAAYLAGAMSNEFDAFILAAAPGYSTLEDGIAGFSEGHNAASDGSRRLTVQYLAEGEDGFAMPDSAYHTICRRAEQFWNYDEMIFPLLGGSGMGIIKYLNSDDLTQALLVGMDVDQAGQSARIPFSMVIRIGDAVKQYLNEWVSGEDWPVTQRLGLNEGMTDITITSNFVDNLNIWDERYEDNDAFLNLYKQYYEQAKNKEAEYVQK